MPKAAYHLICPKRRLTSVIFASPHSGRDYPGCFLRRVAVDPHVVRSSEDAFVDRVFAVAPQMGASFLKAGAPRAFVDLNRGPDELDPALIEGVRQAGHNPRIASGLGVIPRVVANGQAIYSGKLSLDEARQRLETYWHPYHDALQVQMNQAHAMFGEAILIDCHSMPHEAMDLATQTHGGRPEVVLGDRFGVSAGSAIVDQVEAAFTNAGFIVARNTPFAGAYVTQRYGRPARRRHAIQVEIDRALYMDEGRISPNADFNAFRRVMKGVICDIIKIGHPSEQALAAE